MLDILRKNASTWGVKVLLGFIAIVFIFFFGYNTFNRNTKNSGVHNDSVSIGKKVYTLKEIKGVVALIKDTNPFLANLPENYQQQLIPMAINKLAESETIVAAANKAGLTISNLEVSDLITKTPEAAEKDKDPGIIKVAVLWKDGHFDTTFYQQKFRPYYLNRYGLDYEDWTRLILTEAKYTQFWSKLFYFSQKDQDFLAKQNLSQMTFKKIVISSEFLAANYMPENSEVEKLIAIKKETDSHLKSESNEAVKTIVINEMKKSYAAKEAKRMSEELWPLYLSGSVKEDLFQKYNLTEEETKPLTLSNFSEIFSGHFDLAASKQLAGLEESKPYPVEPIKVNNDYYLIKLVKKTSENKEESWQDSIANSLFRLWISEKVAKIEIDPPLQNQ